MQTLDLYIKNGIRIDIDTIMLFDIFGQTQLILILDLLEFLAGSGIIRQRSQTFQQWQIRDPSVCTKLICYPLCQQRIRMKQETSLSDTVCLVVELLRHHLVEIMQFSFFQDLCMQSGYTIDREACNDRHIRHTHLTFIENRHIADLIILVRILLFNLDQETTVNLFHDLINSRQQTHKQINRPFLKGFSHDGVVRISTAS